MLGPFAFGVVLKGGTSTAVAGWLLVPSTASLAGCGTVLVVGWWSWAHCWVLREQPALVGGCFDGPG